MMCLYRTKFGAMYLSKAINHMSVCTPWMTAGCISRLCVSLCCSVGSRGLCSTALRLDSEHSRPADQDLSCPGASSCVAAVLAYSLAFARASFSWRSEVDEHTIKTLV